MRFLPLREVVIPDATGRAYDRWLGELGDRLSDDGVDRNELCREILTDLYYPQYRDANPEELPVPTAMALLQMDPRNITREPDYYRDIDPARYERVKPLLWLWEMFDKSILGENVHLGVKFRRVLAHHIFRRCGRNFKAFHFVKFSFGYNMEVGDDVVVHRHVLLDDRGGIVIGDGASIADYANVYSHTHSLADQRDVGTPVTVIGDGVRVAYHASVLAGVELEADSMAGALAVATKPTAARDVVLGIPAKARMQKPPMEERPDHPRTVDPLADE
ncbi:MAG: acyltransferase [Gemmatimonadota bacterium]